MMIGEQPVRLLRNQRDEPVALSNLCAHRGTLLVEQPINDKRIQQPSNAWTYDDEDRLIGVSFAPSDGLDNYSGNPSFDLTTRNGDSDGDGCS